MTLLNVLFGSVPARRANAGLPTDQQGWFTLSGGVAGSRRTRAGVSIDDDSALTFPAVWCATRILMEAVGGLPLLTYKRRDDDGREAATGLRLYDMLKVSPNPEMEAVSVREGVTGQQVNAGNGFLEVELDQRTKEPLNLWPIHYTRVRPTNDWDKLDPQVYPYVVRNDDSTSIGMKRDEILHIPGVFPADGIWGKGTIAYMRESIGYGLAIRRHGAAYFGSGAQPKGVLTLPGMKDPEARKQYRKEWKEVHGSPESNEVAILPVDAKFTPIMISNNDSQYLESAKLSTVEIATAYRLPPYMLGEYDKAAARASVEAQGIEFIVYSLMPWLRKWEARCNLTLLTPEQRKTYFIEHLLAGLLRGDFKSRMDGYRVGIGIGLMTVNEARRLENMTNIGPAGDLHGIQSNMTTWEAMEKNGGQPPTMGYQTSFNDMADEPEVDALPAADGATEGSFDAWSKRTALQLRNGKAPRSAGRTIAVLETPEPVPTIPALPPAEPVPVPKPEPEPPVKAVSSPVMLAAARSVLADAVRRLAVKESNAAQRAAKGDGWDEWCAAFWLKHRELASSSLRPACEMLATLGVTCDPAELAGRLCDEGDAELRAAYDSETPGKFSERLAAWSESRALAVAGMVPEPVAMPGSVTATTDEAGTATFTVRAQPSPVTLTMEPQPAPQVTVQPQVVNVEAPVVNVPAPIVNFQAAPNRQFKVVPVRDAKTGLVKHYDCVPIEEPASAEKPAAG